MNILDAAMAVANAVSALKLKRARLVSTREGVEIHQQGKPVLLLTHDAAIQFAKDVAEAEA